ncbi:extracellular solute-binding protein [Blautia schinkii]|nr:extracellular solute-binding protein [Blautia schinkii]
MFKKVLSVMLAGCMALSVPFISLKEVKAEDDVVITVMHGTPDTTNPLNQYYEETKKRFEEANPGVKVEFEIYDNETYKKKLQIYGSTKTMPDVFFVWANPSEFLPYVNAGVAAELDPAEFADFDFVPGALEGATVDGKLLGIPQLIDYWYLYYNEKLFTDNNIKVPETIDELKEAITKFNELGIAPVSMNGKDLWNQSVLFNDILLRYTGGDPQPIWDATAMKTSFAETPEFTEAANTYKELVDMGMFQSSWTADDAPTAKNLFQQGKAAMYYTGTWENSLSTEENTPDELKENLRIISFPSVDGKDSHTSLMGREGIVMMVAENSEHKEEAAEFVKTFFNPEYYPKACIENGLGIPMQNFDTYVKDTDPVVIQEVSKSISESTAFASHPFSFRLSAVFEQESKDLNMQFLLGQIDAEQLWKATDDSVAMNQVE